MNNSAKAGSSNRRAGMLGVLAAILIIFGLTTALHARVAFSDPPTFREPLKVAAVRFETQTSYTRPSAFMGKVVAGRRAQLGFEMGGTLTIAPPREGTPVSKGDIIAQLDQAAITAQRDTARADLAQARSELELAKLKATRQRDLQATGAVSKEAYDETRLREQSVHSQVKAAKARLANIEVQYAKSTLVAPYHGIIAERLVYEGAVVSPGAPITRLLETAKQEAHIGVPARLATLFTWGDQFSLRFRDTLFDAPLLSVRPDVNPVTLTATTVFALPEQLTALDGETITLMLPEQVESAGGWLPVSALLEGNRGIWNVLELRTEGDHYRASREAVEVLALEGERAYVRGTLANNALVVSEGLHRINPGSLVVLGRSN